MRREEQEPICRDLGDKANLQEALGEQAAILKDHSRDLDRAMSLHMEPGRLCRETLVRLNPLAVDVRGLPRRFPPPAPRV